MRLMRCYPVSNRVNHVANGDEGCSHRVEIAKRRLLFFRNVISCSSLEWMDVAQDGFALLRKCQNHVASRYRK